MRRALGVCVALAWVVALAAVMVRAEAEVVR